MKSSGVDEILNSRMNAIQQSTIPDKQQKFEGESQSVLITVFLLLINYSFNTYNYKVH